MERSVYFLFMVVSLNFAYSNGNCNCSEKKCKTPINCTEGLVWDHCYCCQVCAKTEGEVCGGHRYFYGECGKWQECVVRNTRDFPNRFKEKESTLIGRCEPYSCAFERCPFGQRCSYLNGYTKCSCNISCDSMIQKPVCGETNMKYYENECQLRKEECQIGKRIGVSILPCPGSEIVQVKCTSSKMELQLSRKLFGRRRPRRLALNDPFCKVSINRTHVTISTSLIGCGTTRRYTMTSVIYSNKLRTLPPKKNAFIRRGKKVNIPFHCEFPMTGRNRNPVRFTQVRPNIEKSMMKGRYTREVGIGKYVEVDTTRNYTIMLRTLTYRGLDIRLMPYHCYAKPVQKDDEITIFTIIEKGCPVERNVLVKSYSDSKIVLQVPGIRFKNVEKPGTYIRCKVRLCFPKAKIKAASCEANCNSNLKRKRKRRSFFSDFKTKPFFRNISPYRKPLIIHQISLPND